MVDHHEDDRSTEAASPLMLRVLNGPQAGRELPVPVLPCRLGRGGQCHPRLQDPQDPPTLSREHATLLLQGGQVVIQDHSRNGTVVDGRRLARGESVPLTPGAVMRLGPLLELEWGTAAPADPRRREPSGPAGQGRPPQDLRERVAAPEALHAAWRRVELNRGAPGPDQVTIAQFSRDAPRRLAELRRLLLRNQYQPLPPRLFAAPKRGGGTRTIAILSIADRVVQQALHAALQPLLEPGFPPCSFAYRPGVCAHHALRAVDRYLAQGLTWVAESDIAAFFDSVPHGPLLDRLAAVVPDPWLLTQVSRCLASGGAAPGVGLPQGAATSPLLSNLYLAEFDCFLLELGRRLVRYGDDLVVPCARRADAQAVLSEAEGYLRSRLQLSLRPDKTRVVPLEAGFTFLGFRFTAEGRAPAPEALVQLHQRLQEAGPSSTPKVLKGWRQYFGPPEAGGGAEPTRSSQAEEPDLARSACAAEGVAGAPGGAGPPAVGRMEDEAGARRFLSLFAGREDLHGRQTFEGGRARVTPCAGPLTLEHVRRHLAGQETFAVYLLRRDATVSLLVLDLDDGDGPPTDTARQAALALRQAARQVGIAAGLEDSGRRGYHLWVFLQNPVPAEEARRLGRWLAAQAGFPRPGLRLEVLPRHTEWPGPELGDAVKLPQGVHPASGRRCWLLGQQGEPQPHLAAALASLAPLATDRLTEILRSGASGPWDPLRVEGPGAPPVTSLLQRCAVVRALCDRAREEGRLRHTHRLILLYTLGRLGQPGAAALHRALSFCRNYRPELCDRYLERLDPRHPPLTCRRVREWLEEEGEAHLCACREERQTPVGDPEADPAGAAARKGARARPRPPMPATLAEPEAWSQVSADLFGNTGTAAKEETDDDAVR